MKYEYIFIKAKNITDLINHLEAGWFIRESWLLYKLYKEKKTWKQIQLELYINSRYTYQKMKQRLFNLLKKYSINDT